MNKKPNVLLVVAVLSVLTACNSPKESESASAPANETSRMTDLRIGAADVDAQGILFIDLEHNRTVKSPARVQFSELKGLEVTPALAEWLRTNSIDLMVQIVAVSAKLGSAAHLRGVNLRGVAVLDDKAWKTGRADASGTGWPTPDPKCELYSSRLLGRRAEVFHALLRTQDNRQYALEEDEPLPEAISIRYAKVPIRH